MRRRTYSERSVLLEVLFALVPYTHQNLLLTFKPNKFFDELEKITGSKRGSLASTMSRAKQNGLIQRSMGVPQLTAKGKALLEQKMPKRARLDYWLLVIFDIPERIMNTRQQLRRFLKANGFVRLQLSVYATNYDYRQDLLKLIKELKLQKYVYVLSSQPVSKFKRLN